MAVKQCSAPHSHSQSQSDESLRFSTHDLQGHFWDLSPEAEWKENEVSNLQFFMQLCNSLWAMPGKWFISIPPIFPGWKIIGQALTIRGLENVVYQMLRKRRNQVFFVCLTASSLCHKGEINRSWQLTQFGEV